MAQLPEPDGARSGAYYRRLELGPDASHEEIVRAYRRLALGAHPDAHPGDPEAPARFREITEAYEVLADTERRRAYDHGHLQRSIPVHRRAPADQEVEAASTGATREGSSPTFLGTPPVSPLDDAPLRAGPVYLEFPRNVRAPTSVSELLEILDSWWNH